MHLLNQKFANSISNQKLLWDQFKHENSKFECSQKFLKYFIKPVSTKTY